MFNFNEFQVAQKANTRVVNKQQGEYNVKFDFKKQRITFDGFIAQEINLINNSLASATNGQRFEQQRH